MSILSRICTAFPRRAGAVLTQLPKPSPSPRRFEQWMGLGQTDNTLVTYRQGTFSSTDLEFRLAMATVFIGPGKKPEVVPYEERDWRLYSANQEGDLVIKVRWDFANQRPYLQVTQLNTQKKP